MGSYRPHHTPVLFPKASGFLEHTDPIPGPGVWGPPTLRGAGLREHPPVPQLCRCKACPPRPPAELGTPVGDAGPSGAGGASLNSVSSPVSCGHAAGPQDGVPRHFLGPLSVLLSLKGPPHPHCHAGLAGLPGLPQRTVSRTIPPKTDPAPARASSMRPTPQDLRGSTGPARAGRPAVVSREHPECAVVPGT